MRSTRMAEGRNVARRVAGGGGGGGGGGSGGPYCVLGGEAEEKGEVNFTTLSYKPKDLSRESEYSSFNPEK
ncbi:hypothetical protein V1478_008179 [Vespula squamosa]|uniref:Uncharacterized protein n=1 Tax=Vespula squamosa TaxID=30214 RepID=A0ABD2AY14_VESSQ